MMASNGAPTMTKLKSMEVRKMRNRIVVQVYIGDDEEAAMLSERIKQYQKDNGLSQKQFWLRSASVFMSASNMPIHKKIGKDLFAYLTRTRATPVKD